MTSVTVRNKITGEFFRVVASIEPTAEFGMSMKSDADISGVTVTKDDPIGNNSISRSQSIRAECFSAAAYARSVLKTDRFSIKILKVAGPFGMKDDPGFAAAVVCAIVTALGDDTTPPLPANNNWEILEAKTEP